MTQATKVVYLFPGQGSHYVGMGKDLYDKYAAAKRVFDRAAEVLDFDVRSVCFEGPAEKLTLTRFGQPSIYVVSMAAFAVFNAHPRRTQFSPQYAAGLSLGEATALTAAGALSFEDGLRFVRARGALMDDASKQNPGMMAAVLGLDLKTTEAACKKVGAEIGNLNAPGQIVISGRRESVEKAIEILRDAGARKVIPLDVSGGFHSSCMDPASEKIKEALEGVAIQRPAVPVVSNLTAREESDPPKIKQNLINQMNHRTLWEDSMRFMIAQGVRTFIEFAPGKVLKGLLKKIDPAAETVALSGVEDFDGIRV